VPKNTLSSCSSNRALSSTLRIFTAFCLVTSLTFASSWTFISPPYKTTAPGTMILLSDGSVMILDGGGRGTSEFNRDWIRLEPDRKGDYSNGNFTKRAPMSIGRLYFPSEVLPDGRLWVLGGEYTGPYSGRNDTNSGEIYDPVANTWSAIAPYPNVSGCSSSAQVVSDVTLETGKTGVREIFSTFGIQVGWTVTGEGIPSGATVVSIDSDKKVNISAPATTSGLSKKVTFTGQAVGCYGATPAILLPGGKKILAGNLVGNTTYIYDVATDSWSFAATKYYTDDTSDEEGWAKLADEKVLTYDITTSINKGAGYAELYDPKTTTWSAISPIDNSAKGTLPLLSSAALGYELGPNLRLQDGRMLIIGANQHTALYTASTNTWAAGPDMLANLSGPGGTITNSFFGADDAPAAELPNGHVILAADAGPGSVSTTGDTASSSAVITNIPSTAGLQVGWNVAQTNGQTDVIPSGTTIASVDSATQVTLSQNTSFTSTGTGLKFGGTFSAPTMLFDFDPKAGTMSTVSPALDDPACPSLSDRLAKP